MKYVIFHGAFTSIEENWFGSLKSYLEAFQHEVLLPQFPSDNYDEFTAAGEEKMKVSPRKQRLENWLATYESTVIPFLNGEPAAFIGHSLGPIFILHALKNFKTQLFGAIFIAPFLNRLPSVPWQYDMNNNEFYSSDFDFAELQGLITRSYALYSPSDPYVPQELAEAFANNVGSSKIVVTNGHHLGSKYTRLPLVEELARTFSDYSV